MAPVVVEVAGDVVLEEGPRNEEKEGPTSAMS